MMRRATLTRFDHGDQGTFGRLEAPGGFACFAGELPWRDNAAGASCVPPGRYPVVWTYSPRFRRFMYLLFETAPRAGIREHSANYMGDEALGYRSQLNGCIAPGELLGIMDGQKAVLRSAPALRRFEFHMERQPFSLEIRNA